MSNKKQRKKEMDDFLNPIILTLDEALTIADQPAANDDDRRDNNSRAVMALYERVSCRFTGPNDFPQLTYGERMVWDLRYLQGEVLNGGYHQYLSNSTADHGEEVKDYVRTIGATSTLELLLELSQIFPGGIIPRDRDERNKVLDQIEATQDMTSRDNTFDRLDDRFYEQSEDLNALIIAYAKTNRRDFAEPPTKS
jgi:hypothetical protein